MNVDQLKRHPLFLMCTEKEQLFLSVFVETAGDMLQAIKSSYEMTGKAALNQARKLQKRSTVVALLDEINGQTLPTKEDLVKECWRHVRRATTPYVALKGIEIIAILEGYKVKPTAEDERQDRIKEAEELDKYAEIFAASSSSQAATTGSSANNSDAGTESTATAKAPIALHSDGSTAGDGR